MFAYNRSFLSGYDFLVHTVNCNLFWQCPTRHVVDLYRRHAGARHLDIGPGTGALLRRSRLSPGTAVHLMDLNEGPLEVARRALPRHRVETHRQDVLKPWDLDEASMDSIAMSLVFHALPGGSIGAKSTAVQEASRVLAPGGRFFGATILPLGRSVRTTARARWLMDSYIRRGVFDNAGDDADELDSVLRDSFGTVRSWTRGCVALWEAWN